MASSSLTFSGLKSEFGSESESNIKHQTFGLVFDKWLLEQEHDMKELMTAAKDHAESTPSTKTELTKYLVQLVDRVMSHYEKYYLAKSESSRQNVLLVLNPSWLTRLETAFLWVGGWRPTMAFHLLYSTSGKQLGAALSELLSELSDSSEFNGLSLSQLVRVNELQGETIKREKELSESLAAQQETVADSYMVELSELATELTRAESDSVRERVELALAPKEKEFGEILRKADDLRLVTLKKLVNILKPIQAVHLFIAAAQLHLRVHEWGKDNNHALAQTQAHGSSPGPSPSELT